MRFVNETKVWTLESGCDAEKIDALPPLGFVMGNKIFQLTARQYIVAVRSDSLGCSMYKEKVAEHQSLYDGQEGRKST